jgi:hypothetical protein
MADYKIKLEIDASQLEKTLKQVLKKNLGGFAGGATGAGASKSAKVSNTIKDAQQTIKDALLDEATIRRMALLRLKREHMREYKELSARNTRLRQQGVNESRSFRNIGQLFGGEVGGAIGSIMDLIGTKTGFMRDKDGKEKKGALPQAVKLAGIAAGIAGAAGFGKMIIDSSPVLKAMLKLLNVGIMLILRPIGDFIGFMLRPLLIEFVRKVAIPAYRSGASLAKKWGTAFGAALLNFFVDPIGTIATAIRQGTAGVLSEAGDEISQGIMDYFLPSAGACPGEEIAMTPWEELQQQLLEAEVEKLDQIKESTDKISTAIDATKDIYPWLQGGDKKEPADTRTDLEKAIDESKEKWPEWFGDNYAQTAQDSNFEKARLDEERRLAEEEEKRSTTSEEFFKPKEQGAHIIPHAGLSPAAQKAIAQYEAWKRGEAWAGGAAQAGGREGTNVNPLATCQMGGMAGTGVFESYMAEDGSKMSSEIFEYQNFAADSREQMEAYSKAIEESAQTGNTIKEEYDKIMATTLAATAQANQATNNQRLIKASTWEAKRNIEHMTSDTKNMADNMNATAKYVASLLRRGYSIRKESGARRYPQLGPMASGLDNAFGSPSVGITQKDKYRITLGDGRTHEQILDPNSLKYFNDLRAAGRPFRGSPILSIQKMASGGLITEPIFGVGQNTGKGYLMGEAGPERITPGAGQAPSTGGGNTFNITINASGIGDIERQLKPAILKMIKESTARAGIV